MKKQIKYFLSGIIILLISSPIGYFLVNTIYANQNLSGEYITLLNGFIYSFMLVGILVFCMGLVNVFIEKKYK
ncbi:glycosyl transferase [Romboutsia ilealis]|uniref:Glycosyl transferase n=1 Tax=Romboutsia faecis TaxID=2764597 RepID=A0ABR7JNR0_9FIRM|nr:glycosyl transferase [Romboutsia faecis]MBC5996557.1 glycosyl transferase [Romboutsia faecis]MRN24083.1 glycosyl transferase [Romboutsia ilealis]